MLQVVRAEDGHLFQVNPALGDIKQLKSVLSQATAIDEDAVLAYLEDARRITDDNIQELSTSKDQTIFVFNKYYLDYDLNEVLEDLRIEVPQQPQIDDSLDATPPARPSYAANFYFDHIMHLQQTLHRQHDAILIASTSLDLNVLAISDAFEGIAEGCRRDLEKQATLLSGIESDLELISRVQIHVEFLSPSVRKAIESGEKPRTLGDYVSTVKMTQVAETCARTHEDLRTRLNEAEQAVSTLSTEASTVRSTVTNILQFSVLEEADSCLQKSQGIFEDRSNSIADISLREQLQYITQRKNSYTEQCIVALRQISNLNHSIVQLPTTLTNLQASFRGKNSFSHIQRLHNMLYAYGATVIEVVRRKEFARFFYQRSQSILEVMARFSANEKKRRLLYRSDVHGQLPFETRGMDDLVPTIDFSPSGNPDGISYSLERADVNALLSCLEDIEQIVSRSPQNPRLVKNIRDCKLNLEKLASKMDTLQSGFDRIAERSLLSTSHLSSSRRRSTAADEKALQELTDRLQNVERSQTHKETQFKNELSSLQSEIQRLQSELATAKDSTSIEKSRAAELENELQLARVQLDEEGKTRRVLKARQTELEQENERQRQELAKAFHLVDVGRQELSQVQSEFDAVKRMQEEGSAKVAILLQEQATHLRELDESRERGENLQEQIRAARAECEAVNTTLKDSSQETEHLLRTQASEHDRLLRDHIAEADSDRAVLEHQFSELKNIQQETEHRLVDTRAELETTKSDADNLREELRRLEQELRSTVHAERILRHDLSIGRSSQSEFENRLERSNRLVAEILNVAIAFRNSHVKALNSAQAMNSHPNPKHSINLADSTFSSGLKHSIISHMDEPSPIDPSDPSAALEILRAFDHDTFLEESIGKMGSTIRKWQKQCKDYRERAKGKIAFRAFAKGDLALFLPTRNSITKPWAAFNVSFPHYFLQASTGHLADQLKTREWIVARITNITERIADPKENPYSLGEGVKYFVLDVEDWTQPSQQSKRRVNSKKTPVLDEPELLFSESNGTIAPPPAVTRPPSSHLFPTRSRSNSSPKARPSSLSRLLAQGPLESPAPKSPVPNSSTPDSPPTSPPPPPSPSLPSPSKNTSPLHGPGGILSSPLRPTSRASKLSTSSRISRGRALGSSTSLNVVKAAPTTAVTGLPSSLSSTEDNPFIHPATPSPNDSISEGMNNVIKNRRRTTSYHVTSPLSANQPTTVSDTNNATATLSRAGTVSGGTTLANLANSWGVAFGKKKRAEQAERSANESSASQLLKRF